MTAVRKVALEARGFRSVDVTSSQMNRGLAASVITGVETALEFSDSVIVLEDDVAAEGYARGSVCGCAFRRTFLTDHGISFDPTLSIAADTFFFATALSAGGRLEFMDIPFYGIRERKDSAFRKQDADSLYRYGMALGASKRISHQLLRTRTSLSLILGITDVPIAMGLRPDEAYTQAGLTTVLPLPVEGMGREGWAIRLLNGNCPVFFRLKQIRNRLRK